MSKNADNGSLHIAKLFPNMVTIFGLCLGLTAIRFAMLDEWKMAAAFIVFASIVDAMDGRLARMMNATSEFGAQIDSLSDFVNFGVAPGFILYLWAGHEIKGVGWAMALFFAICCAIRLARFNSDHGDEGKPGWSDRFFIGIPAPAGAMLALAPLGVDFAFKVEFPEIYDLLSFAVTPLFVCIYGATIAILMASRMPTFSFKTVKIKRAYISLVLAFVGLLVIAAFTEPWLTIIGVGIWYILTIPLSLAQFYIQANQAKK